MSAAKSSGQAAVVEHQLIRGDSLRALDRVPDGSCRLVITSPPYNIRKEYEREERRSIAEYVAWLEPIVEKACRKVAADGHLCWQVGNYVRNGEVVPLDYYFYEMISKRGFKLRNRIVWHFNFGLHATKRFSGRYETVLWFSKSDDYFFQLDPVRVRQLYPGKRHSSKKGVKAGMPSGNAKGKNPSDFWIFDADEAMSQQVWDFPNVKANHAEKTVHPCQFPSELVERCVLALTEPGDSVLDPFVGVGTTVLAAAMHGRRGIGIDKSSKYVKLAKQRLALLQRGELVTRPIWRSLRSPRPDERVAQVPTEWKTAAE